MAQASLPAPARLQSSGPPLKQMAGAEKKGGTLLEPRQLPAGSRYGTLLRERQKTLGGGDIWQQVKLPPGASEDEWLAVTTVDFFNELNLLAGAISDICTESSCPEMCAG